MLHSTLRKVITTHKIKADSLSYGRKARMLWFISNQKLNSLHKYLVNSGKWALVLGFQLCLRGLL